MPGRSRKPKGQTPTAAPQSRRASTTATPAPRAHEIIGVRRGKKKALVVGEALAATGNADGVDRSVGVRSAVRQVFLDRVMNLFTDLADNASDSVIATALAEPTALGTAALALAESVAAAQPLDEADRQIAAALAAGAQYKEELLTRAGGAYSAEQLAQLLGISRQAVNEGRKTHLYFAVPSGQSYVYPKLQLTSRGPLPGLRDFLDGFSLPDAWMKLSVLVEPSERLGGRSPLEALREGDVEAAVLVAATYGGHGA
jgi:hypothetical protein